MANSNDGEGIYDQSLRLHNRIWNELSTITDPSWPAKDPNNISILHHNSKSLCKNLHFYESLQLYNHVDIFSISETWLKPDMQDSLITLPQFSIVRCDRKSSTKTRDGRAALYIKSCYKIEQLYNPAKKLQHLCDSVWVNLHSENTKDTLTIISIYLPPDSDKTEFINQLSSILHQRNFINKKVILVGDFNINFNADSKDKQHIEQSLLSVSLKQVLAGVSFVSHQGRESLIDHNYVNSNLSIKSCSILTCERSISDHYATLLTLDFIKPASNSRKLITTRNYHKINHISFFNDCSSLPLIETAHDRTLDIHQRVNEIDQLIISVVDKHAPEKNTPG